MSRSRTLLKNAIERGEEENGSIEFKESLSKDIHLADAKRNSLVGQLRHRVLSGDGEATYVVGVDDSGEIKGLSRERFEETLDVLSLISQEADSHISSTETWPVNDGDRLVGLVTVRDGEKMDLDNDHLVIGTAGHVDHGKSSLIGSLVTGKEDDGVGGMRSYLDVQPHEIERGLSADLSYAVYGFDDEGSPLHLNNPDRNHERSEVVETADRLISFVDTVGHEPWLRTTIRGLVGQRLDYGLLAVSAEDGPTKTTREHLGILLAMNLPTIVAITKTDLVDEERIIEVEKEIEHLLRHSGCDALLHTRYSTDEIVDQIDERVVPVVRTSSVTRDGLDSLDTLFNTLPKNKLNENNDDFRMYIDKTYVVEGVGTVVSGSIMSGSIEVGDELKLGPTTKGDFIDTKARSIEIHYHKVDKAETGQLVSVALKNVDESQVNRGMVITKSDDEDLAPVQEFEAELMILNHPTSISDGYEPFLHLETVSETVTVHPEDGPLLPGDTGKATVKFKFNPYVISEGQRFVFREGNAKGVGTVTNVE